MKPLAKLSVFALDCAEPRILAEFYSAITGLPIVRDDGDWVQLGGDAGATLAFQLAPDHTPPRWPDPDHPQQAHIDFVVDDLVTATEQVLALGARKAEFQPEEDFVVFLDPAGHPFCFVTS